MRVCLAYDCLFPHTIGGAERWYRNVAERLAAAGHEVTYLTLRQWGRRERPDLPAGVRVVVVGPRMDLYAGGRRRILPPLVFGVGVLWHLLLHGRRYEVVHTCAFPYFSVLAARTAGVVHRFGLLVDWFEVWSPEYWHDYLGRAGSVGVLIQRLCVRATPRAFCFSNTHAARLQHEGLTTKATVLRGLYSSDRTQASEQTAEVDGNDPTVVFAGRLTSEKRTPAIVRAVAIAAQSVPTLRGVVFGDGPERPAVEAEIASLGAPVTTRGIASSDEVARTLGGSMCLLLASAREGYGLVVVEAAAKGVPSIVVDGPDNAATELIEDGVNGFITSSPEPDELAQAIIRVHRAGRALRSSTQAWYEAHADELSLERSLEQLVATYAELSAA